MSTIGEANIGVGFDLSKFGPEINEIVNLVSQAVDKMKGILHFTADGIDGEKVEQQFEGISNEAQKADKNIRGVGEAGKDSIRELLKFEVVKQAVQSVQEAFSRVKDYVMGFVEDFAAADLSVNKLRGGLERIGQTGWFDTLIKQAGQLSKITPFDDDDITNMQSMLTTFDGISAEAVGKLTPAMLNLASAFAQGGDSGMNLTQVAILIGKSAGAELWSALKRVGIVMTETQQHLLETTSGMERINVFLEIMAQNGNITAEAFGKTLAGQLQIAKNEIGNVSEALGEAMAPAAEYVIGLVKGFSENLQKLPDAAKIAIVAIGAIIIAASTLAAVFTVLDVTTGGLLLALGVLVTGIAAVITTIIANIDAVKEFITGNEQLNKIANDLIYSFEELKDSFGDFWDELSNVIGNTKNLREVIVLLIENELRGLLVILNLVVKAFDFVINVLTLAARGFGIFKDAVFYAVGAIVEKVQSGFNLVKNIIQSVLDLFGMGVPQGFTNSITAVVDSAISKISALRNAVRNLFGLGDWANESPVEKTAGSGTTATTWKAGDFAPKTAPKTPDAGSEKGDKKDEDPYKEETKNLKELMDTHEKYLKQIKDRIELGELTPLATLEEIKNYKASLMQQQAILESAKNKQDVDTKILDIRVQEKKILDSFNNALKDSGTIGKKIADEDRKRFNENMKLEAKASDELESKKINNETNAYRKSIDLINQKWDKEDERINATYENSVNKEALLYENKVARNKELQDAEIADSTSLLGMISNGFNNVQSAISSGFSNMWDSVFGEANSLFEILMKNVYAQLIALAASGIFKMIVNVLSGGIGGTILGFLGFDSGGFTGLGASGEIAGIVHKNEFVVSSKGVNSSTLPLLDALNRGQNISAFLQDTVRVPNVSLPDFKVEPRNEAAGKTVLNINLGGVEVSSSSLLGTSKSELMRAVKEELAPELSAFLRRSGKKFLDNTIKK